jgi:ribonuclease E
VAQPRTPSRVAIDGGTEEECTTNENTSTEGAKEYRSVEPMNKEYRSVEPMNEERSVKTTDKRAAGSKAEVAKPKTAEVAKPAAAEAAEPAAEVSKPATAETMATTTKPHRRRCRGVR